MFTYVYHIQLHLVEFTFSKSFDNKLGSKFKFFVLSILIRFFCYFLIKLYFKFKSYFWVERKIYWFTIMLFGKYFLRQLKCFKSNLTVRNFVFRVCQNCEIPAIFESEKKLSNVWLIMRKILKSTIFWLSKRF